MNRDHNEGVLRDVDRCRNFFGDVDNTRAENDSQRGRTPPAHDVSTWYMQSQAVLTTKVEVLKGGRRYIH